MVIHQFDLAIAIIAHTQLLATAFQSIQIYFTSRNLACIGVIFHLVES